MISVNRVGWIVSIAVATAVFGLLAAGAPQAASTQVRVYSVAQKGYVMVDKVVKTDEEWRKILTPEQFNITRRQGTERSCSGAYWNNHQDGVYRCVCCGNDLFQSLKKFDSKTGWPSFFAPVDPANITTQVDDSYGMRRTEVLCARCDAHLGHVFDDGPPPNSVALKFVPAKDLKK